MRFLTDNALCRWSRKAPPFLVAGALKCAYDIGPEPAATRAVRQQRRQRPLTLSLWWIVLYLTIIYLAIRLGAHPALTDVG